MASVSNEIILPASTSIDSEKMFPPFPEPVDADFDDDIKEDERKYYLEKFTDLNAVVKYKLHCTACDRHLGSSILSETRMRSHPMLRTLMCNICHKFYNSGEFDRGEDGSELYCRWCGQGGQVYCCSNCIHVFCAKCIKRNLGPSKIKEIENTDDWKCFKCFPNCLWEARAMCWALLRYCDQRNKLINSTEDSTLKQHYKSESTVDRSECCKDKRRKPANRLSIPKKKEEKDEKKTEPESNSQRNQIITDNVSDTIAKIPPSIQVKKFAQVNSTVKPKKIIKRPHGGQVEQLKLNNPIAIAPLMRPINKSVVFASPSLPKKIRLHQVSRPPVNFRQGMYNYKPRTPQLRPIYNNPSFFPNQMLNGCNADNLNLSLENLTQGLDLNSVANNINSDVPDGDIVCTPDFPLEPICEVMEDIDDDDVECITPSVPPNPSKNSAINNNKQEMDIVQMTDKDVTVNSVTGGLKFRVDPQTLSSNKMYRLPDGRVFSINVNPSLPGGYSATIVAVEKNVPNAVKGQIYAAKVTALTPKVQVPTKVKNVSINCKKNTNVKNKKEINNCDGSGTYYKYCLIDAMDSLEYSLSRLKKLQKQASKSFLETRTKQEIYRLHMTLNNVLKVSSTRFEEIRGNFGKPMSHNSNNIDDEDDDDVEILSNNEDPIFIDENSIGSDNANVSESAVDLVSSDVNESGEKGDLERGLHQNENSENEDSVMKEKGSFISVTPSDTNSVDVDSNMACENENQEPSDYNAVEKDLTRLETNNIKEEDEKLLTNVSKTKKNIDDLPVDKHNSKQEKSSDIAECKYKENVGVQKAEIDGKIKENTDSTENGVREVRLDDINKNLQVNACGLLCNETLTKDNSALEIHSDDSSKEG